MAALPTAPLDSGFRGNDVSFATVSSWRASLCGPISCHPLTAVNVYRLPGD